MSTSGDAADATLNSLADKLFRCLREGDYDTAATCFAPDATWWLNGVPQGKVADVLAKRKAQPHPLGPHTHGEIRRLFSSGAFVEQHVNRWTGPDGRPKELFVCIVVRLNPASLVTRFEEYYDNAVRQAAMTAVR